MRSIKEMDKRLDEREQEIERLNKKIEQYENPEDMTLMFMWCDEKAKDEIKRLKNDIKRITEITNQKIKIINEVREYIKERTTHYTSYLGKEPKVVPKIELQREAYDKLLEILDRVGDKE